MKTMPTKAGGDPKSSTMTTIETEVQVIIGSLELGGLRKVVLSMVRPRVLVETKTLHFHVPTSTKFGDYM